MTLVRQHYHQYTLLPHTCFLEHISPLSLGTMENSPSPPVAAPEPTTDHNDGKNPNNNGHSPWPS